MENIKEIDVVAVIKRASINSNEYVPIEEIVKEFKGHEGTVTKLLYELEQIGYLERKGGCFRYLGSRFHIGTDYNSDESKLTNLDFARLYPRVNNL